MLALGTPYELLLALDTLGAGNWLLNGWCSNTLRYKKINWGGGVLAVKITVYFYEAKIDPTCLQNSLDGSYY